MAAPEGINEQNVTDWLVATVSPEMGAPVEPPLTFELIPTAIICQKQHGDVRRRSPVARDRRRT